MNDLLEQALLYDFYGELLTDHQKEIYEQFVLEDLSLSEIAEAAGISRQGVHDLIKRCNKILEGYEAKLHLVERFLSVKEKVEKNENADNIEKSEKKENTDKIRKLEKTENTNNINEIDNNNNLDEIHTNKTENIKATEQTIEEGTYKINTCIDSNKYIDVSRGSKNNEANIQIWDKSNVDQQKYEITYLNNGYYKITAVHSGKGLDVESAGKDNGTNVWQYEWNGSDAQQWIIQEEGNGKYSIISKCNELYLDVNGANNSNGTNVQEYEGNGSKAQQFKFEKYEPLQGKKTIEDGTYKIKINALLLEGYSGFSNVLEYYSDGSNYQEEIVKLEKLTVTDEEADKEANKQWLFENVFKCVFLYKGFYTESNEIKVYNYLKEDIDAELTADKENITLIKRNEDQAVLACSIENKNENIKDIEILRKWRNDPKISSLMLRQNGEYITKEQQLKWYDSIKDKTDALYYMAFVDEIAVGYFCFVAAFTEPLEPVVIE